MRRRDFFLALISGCVFTVNWEWWSQGIALGFALVCILACLLKIVHQLEALNVHVEVTPTIHVSPPRARSEENVP